MKYTLTLTIVVEAVQFTYKRNLPDGVIKKGRNFYIYDHLQKVLVRSGDWILTRDDGTKYSIPDEKFKRLYKPV